MVQKTMENFFCIFPRPNRNFFATRNKKYVFLSVKSTRFNCNFKTGNNFDSGSNKNKFSAQSFIKAKVPLFYQKKYER